METAIIIDLDGTLCDPSQRIHYIIGDGKKDWSSFFSNLHTDSCNSGVKLVYNMAVNYDIAVIYVTGRPEEYRLQTIKWLQDNDVDNYHMLLMRRDKDKRDDNILKEEIYKLHVEPYFDVKFVLEDRSRVVDMWRSLGLTCFQVAPGDF